MFGCHSLLFLVVLNNVISTHETTKNKSQGQDNNPYRSWCSLNHALYLDSTFFWLFLDGCITPIDISLIIVNYYFSF